MVGKNVSIVKASNFVGALHLLRCGLGECLVRIVETQPEDDCQQPHREQDQRNGESEEPGSWPPPAGSQHSTGSGDIGKNMAHPSCAAKIGQLGESQQIISLN